MKILLARHWFTAVLSILGLISPVQLSHDGLLMHHPQPMAVLVKTHQTPKIVKAQTKHAVMTGLGYSYMISGKALCDGSACVDAQVEIQLTSDTGSSYQIVRTDAQGNYVSTVALSGHPNQAVSFEITALKTDFQPQTLEGRQILTGIRSVQINAPLTLVR